MLASSSWSPAGAFVAGWAAGAAAGWTGLPYLGLTDAPEGGSLVASAQDEQLWNDYADLHRDFVGAGPVRHVSFESGALGQ